jgi:uncharacterized membrane protein
MSDDLQHEKTADELISHNVETIRDLQQAARRSAHADHRAITEITRLLARPGAVYTTVAVAGVWIVVNTFAGKPLDPPPFSYLETFLTLAAFLTTLVVLSTQRRQVRVAEQRAHLELQINLLAEHKIAKLIALVEELRRDLPNVPDRVDRIAETMKEPTSPHRVLGALDEPLGED